VYATFGAAAAPPAPKIFELQQLAVAMPSSGNRSQKKYFKLILLVLTRPGHS
jgi:hypothetical protein